MAAHRTRVPAVGTTRRQWQACQEALRLLEPGGDQWGLAHAQALLGTIARSEHRLPEAIEHLSGAAAAAARLGFTAAEAYHLSNLGRVQELSGEPQGPSAPSEVRSRRLPLQGISGRPR